MKTYKLPQRPVSTQIDYQAALNDQQRQVVRAGAGYHLVVAGPGSGKTRTLTYRVAYLIEQGVPAQAIILCTFTKKAASEMQKRVQQLFHYPDQVNMGTFHHLANRLLRFYVDHPDSPLPDFDANFGILDREDVLDLLAACIDKHKSASGVVRPPVLEALINLAQNRMISLEQCLLEQAPAMLPHLDSILSIASAYQEHKRSMNMMDFDDLLVYLRLLLQDVACASQIKECCQHVLVDEFQDTSPIQAELVYLLSQTHNNLLVVGDDAQSIYGFRGADPSNMAGMLERFGETQLHKLEINYRSTPQILNLANATMEKASSIPKQLVATVPEGDLPVLANVTDSDMEAHFVAQRVEDFLADGFELDHMAVLYRAHHHSMELQIELTRREIPYRVRSGVRFFEQAHIKDVLSYLKIISNPRESLSWLRVLRLQPGIGRMGAANILGQLQATGQPLRTCLALDAQQVSPHHRKAFADFQSLMHKLVHLDETSSKISEAINLITDAGYTKDLAKRYHNAQNRLDDINQMAAYADRFKSVQTFLAELNLVAAFGSDEVVPEDDGPQSSLTLSSIHQAKGLEWEIVFVLSLNEGSLPHPRSCKTEAELEEERRLFYVAQTRAKNQLILTSRQIDERRYARMQFLKPSRFLKELSGRKLFERWQIE